MPRVGLLGVMAGVLAAGFVVFDWYRFATSGGMSKTEGVFGDLHLEVWIDVNARMPEAALWARAGIARAALGG